jgi:hypothetical protein
VADDVGERLLRDPVEAQLDVGRQPEGVEAVECDLHREAAGRRLLLGQPLERRTEAGDGENARVQLSREPAQPLERLGGEAREPVELPPGRGVGAGVGQGAEAEAEERQHLPHLVVEIARDPLPLLLLDRDQPGQQATSRFALARAR